MTKKGLPEIFQRNRIATPISSQIDADA